MKATAPLMMPKAIRRENHCRRRVHRRGPTELKQLKRQIKAIENGTLGQLLQEFPMSDSMTTPSPPIVQQLCGRTSSHATIQTEDEFPPSVTIDRPRNELYAFWRNFINLSRFMWGVRRVEAIDGSHARWVIGTNEEDELVWETVIVEDRPDAAIAWRTVSLSRTIHAGRVEFHDAKGGGTTVSVAVAYERLSGALGERFARLFHHNPALQTQLELQRFKRLLESNQNGGGL